jgi:hypothetical protein
MTAMKRNTQRADGAEHATLFLFNPKIGNDFSICSSPTAFIKIYQDFNQLSANLTTMDEPHDEHCRKHAVSLDSRDIFQVQAYCNASYRYHQ